uniref:Lipid scramblase CLPTM1L n=1 Tax=Tetraodon nigroviridis TaxID=99883 RepID=H3CW79_TETNG
MSEDFTFSQAGLPSDLRRYMKVAQDGGRMIYLPLLLVNELHFRVRDLMEIGSSTLQLPLTVSYEGTSLRTFRFWVHLHEAVYFLRQFGFAEEFIEEIKETLSGSNLGVLAAAALLTAVQLVWEALALKNDIIAWRKKRSTVGISRTSILWRCLCSWLSFLHLLEETSLLVLLPVGLGACTEAWKVFKVFSIRRKASRLQVKKTDDEERKTMEFDAQASRYLSYLVSPLCVGGAVLSLFYLRHRSVYSWLINTLVTGVYAFGFLSMAPQLFVNYKLASVSHLPTAVLVYRGANTLISDLGAGACFFSPSLCVSSSHGLSFFRDELLLFIHLYQRWCFSPKTRRRESATQSKKVKTH